MAKLCSLAGQVRKKPLVHVSDSEVKEAEACSRFHFPLENQPGQPVTFYSKTCNIFTFLKGQVRVLLVSKVKQMHQKRTLCCFSFVARFKFKRLKSTKVT